MALQLHNKKKHRGHARAPSDMMLYEDPFSNSQSIFSRMNRMMTQVDSMMNGMFSSVMEPFPSSSNIRAQAHRGDLLRFPAVNAMAQHPNCQVYTSSEVMSMVRGPDGQAQVYQASSSTTALPGGIRETKKTVCDSRSGVQKMSLGHHIGDRGRVIERQKNLLSGEAEEHQEFINLDEDEAEPFDREFEHLLRHGTHAIAPASRGPRPHNATRGNGGLTPEAIALNRGASHAASRLSAPAKGKRGFIRGALRKVRK